MLLLVIAMGMGEYFLSETTTAESIGVVASFPPANRTIASRPAINPGQPESTLVLTTLIFQQLPSCQQRTAVRFG